MILFGLVLIQVYCPISCFSFCNFAITPSCDLTKDSSSYIPRLFLLSLQIAVAQMASIHTSTKQKKKCRAPPLGSSLKKGGNEAEIIRLENKAAMCWLSSPLLNQSRFFKRQKRLRNVKRNDGRLVGWAEWDCSIVVIFLLFRSHSSRTRC